MTSTMEYRPTITYSYSETGDESLFLTLSTHLRKILQDQTVKWKPTYGRTPHELTLDVKFLPLTSALLTRNDLVTRPYFHVFWTDCNDIDFYRSNVKSEIASWLSELIANDVFDWMIVVVTGDGTSRSSKPKLTLPRSSLADKIKTDFCSKHPGRMHVLQDPMKESSKTAEAWLALSAKLASFTVICLEQAVTKYEERVRAERERRNDKSWNFCSYFLMQEELAFMFEMLKLYEEALIQYNELDAMFTQYLLNAHAGDVAHWLSTFTLHPITRWRALSLWRRIDGDARQMLVNGIATLIDVRNYLFARHCHLLFAIGDIKRITKLMHTFLHSTVLELDILEIELPPGAKECWLFMSCMELTQTLDRHRKRLQNSHKDDGKINISYEDLRLETANLWNVARQKLLKLGELCGLMPDVETKSEDLQTVVDLIAGMGEEEERDELTKSPSLILREILSSKENFRTQYLSLSELAMGIYKHKGRFRSARSIGQDLAEFYMRSGEPEKAESFLVDCVRAFSNESWPLLTANASEKLAECYKRLCNVRRYIRLCCALMCDKYISEKRRSFYSDEIHSHSTDFGDHSLPLLLAVFANVTAVQFVPARTSIRFKSKQCLSLHVHSDAPKAMRFQTVQISLRRQDQDNTDTSNRSHCDLPEEPEIDVFSYATFSSDEDECETVSLDKSTDSLSSAQRLPVQHKNHIHRKRRFPSTSSYDSIYALQQKTKLDSDGLVQLVTMEESFSQPSKCNASVLPCRINVNFECESKSDEIAWAGITCRTANKLLRRQDSYQSLRSIHASATNIVMENYEVVIEKKDVLIQPGDNIIEIEVDTSKPGDFTFRQLRFTMNKVHFVLPRILPVISYTVTREEPTIHLAQESSMYCGMRQTLTVSIFTGDYELNSADEKLLGLNLPKRLRILSVSSLSVVTENGGKTVHELPKVLISDTRHSIELPSLSVHSTVSVGLCCVYDLPDSIHELDYKCHRRTHSAPPSTVHKRVSSPASDYVNVTHDDLTKTPSNQEKNDLLDGKRLKMPKSPFSPFSKSNNRGSDSPVKKFLSFVREVADRSENKNNKTERKIEKDDILLSHPTVLFKDDFLEVTLEEPPIDQRGRVATFPIETKTHKRYRSETFSFNHSGDGQHTDSNSTASSEESPLHYTSTVKVPSVKKCASLSVNHENVVRRHGNTLPVQEEPEDDRKIISNVSIHLPWNSMMPFSMSLTFTRPLEFKHKQHRFYSTKVENSSSAVHRVVSVSMENQSPHLLGLRNHCLKISNCGQVTITNLNEDSEKCFESGRSITFAWRIAFAFSKLNRCSAIFGVDVVSKSADGAETVAPVTYRFEVDNVQTIYIVSTKLGKDNDPLVSGQMTTLEITVKRNRSDPEHEHTRTGQQLLMFQVVDTRGRWAVCGKSTGILSLPLLPSTEQDSESDDCVATAELEVMPLINGYLHRPSVVLQRYLKRNSSEFDEELSSTESPVMKPPRLLDFRPGEVVYVDECNQVFVSNFPPKTNNADQKQSKPNIIQKTKF